MKFHVIACRMFRRELAVAAATTTHTLTFDYLDIGEHVRPQSLRAKLQRRIDAVVEADAILLAYGLCGMATEGLVARAIPVVIPRSHDCGGILLGCRKRFEKIFRDMPSTPFSSVGMVENSDCYFEDGERLRGDNWSALLEKYGEDNARYIWEAMQPRLEGELQPVHFIATPGIDDAAACEACRSRAQGEGRGFRVVSGDLRLLTMLLRGEHPHDEFLVVAPGEVIKQVGDWDLIIRAGVAAV